MKTSTFERPALETRQGGRLHGLFSDELAEMHDAEQRLTHALPVIIQAVKSRELRELLDLQKKEAEARLKLIERIGGALGGELPKRTSEGMKGLIREGVQLLARNIASPVLDTSLISAAQKFAHYKIASYGTLCSWAKLLGFNHELVLLKSILDREKLAAALLTGVAEGSVSWGELIQQFSPGIAEAE